MIHYLSLWYTRLTAALHTTTVIRSYIWETTCLRVLGPTSWSACRGCQCWMWEITRSRSYPMTSRNSPPSRGWTSLTMIYPRELSPLSLCLTVDVYAKLCSLYALYFDYDTMTMIYVIWLWYQSELSSLYWISLLHQENSEPIKQMESTSLTFFR